MISSSHTFTTEIHWQGAPMRPDERRFSRAHRISAPGLPPIEGSAAKTFHGDADRWNPELLLISAVAECHMMTFLFLAKQEGVTVTAYECSASGKLQLDPDGIGGEFASFTLAPAVSFMADTERNITVESVNALHEQVEKYCFIARSVRAPITIRASATAD